MFINVYYVYGYTTFRVEKCFDFYTHIHLQIAFCKVNSSKSYQYILNAYEKTKTDRTNLEKYYKKIFFVIKT